MMFNTTFNNISAISWQPVVLVEETEVSGETTDLPQVTNIASSNPTETRCTRYNIM